MDSGIDYTHPDLAGHVDVSAGYNFLHDNPGWSDKYSSQDVMDDFSHGTHVAGTVGATGDNGQGVVGVCWDVTMVPLKIWDNDGRGTEAEFIEALVYAEETQLPIVNLSGGIVPAYHDATYLQALREAIDAYSGLLIVAAGNNSHNNDDDNGLESCPAAFDCDNIISVTASDEQDSLCGFSAYGETSVDLAAPGDYILSAVIGNDTGTFLGGYDFKRGTSMATPHVTGSVALLKAYNPNLTNAQIKAAILDNVDARPDLAGMVLTGGRLNIYKALRSVMNEYNDIGVMFVPDHVDLLDILQGGSTTVQASATSNSRHVVWSLLNPPEGVSINCATGVISVTSGAREGAVNVVATCGSLTGASSLSVNTDGIIRWSPSASSTSIKGNIGYRKGYDRAYSIISDQTAVVTLYGQSYGDLSVQYNLFDEMGNEVCSGSYFPAGTDTFVMQAGVRYTISLHGTDYNGNRESWYELTLDQLGENETIYWTPSGGAVSRTSNMVSPSSYTKAYDVVSDETTMANLDMALSYSYDTLHYWVYDVQGRLLDESYAIMDQSSTSTFLMSAGEHYTILLSLEGSEYRSGMSILTLSAVEAEGPDDTIYWSPSGTDGTLSIDTVFATGEYSGTYTIVSDETVYVGLSQSGDPGYFSCTVTPPDEMYNIVAYTSSRWSYPYVFKMEAGQQYVFSVTKDTYDGLASACAVELEVVQREFSWSPSEGTLFLGGYSGGYVGPQNGDEAIYFVTSNETFTANMDLSIYGDAALDFSVYDDEGNYVAGGFGYSYEEFFVDPFVMEANTCYTFRFHAHHYSARQLWFSLNLSAS